jgi:predicted anti-sigma-YlaC factor YlaD
MAGDPLERDRSCRRAREWVSLRLDGELSELERLLLRRHLARCEGCRTTAEHVERTATLMRSAPLEHPSRGVAEALPARTRPRIRYRILAAAAVVAAGVGIGSVAGISGDGATPVAPQPPTTEIALLPPSGEQVTPVPPARLPVEPPGEPV